MFLMPNVFYLLSIAPHSQTSTTVGMLNRKTDDSALLSTFSKHHLLKPSAKSPPPLYDIPKFHKNERFIIRHFAGEVEYSIHGFLSKNNISLQEDVQEVIKYSTSSLIRKIFSVTDEEDEPIISEENELFADETVVNTLRNQSLNAEADASSDTSPSTNSRSNPHHHPLVRLTGGSKRFAGQVTVSSHFREQLADLLTSLETTRTHYIKCIKPNEFKNQIEFNSKLIMQQLQCNGIMELVRIKRQGYPTHSEFSNFYHVFHILGYHQQQQLQQRWKLPSEFPSIDEYTYYCSEICAQCLPKNMYQIGIHKVFLRDGFEIYLREEKLKIFNFLVTKIQSHISRYLQQKRYRFVYLKIISIQKRYRCYYYTKLFQKKVMSIIRIQSIFRKFLQRKLYENIKKKIILIQKTSRKFRQQQKFLRICQSVQLLQQGIRIYFAKKELNQRKLMRKRILSSVLIQKIARIYLAKKILLELVRLEKERIEAEEAEKIRIANELAEQERQIKLELERLEKERLAAEEAEKARLVFEEQQRIRLVEEAERLERERRAAEEAEKSRLEAEELERTRLAEEAERERIAVEEAESARQLAEAEQKRRSLLRDKALESRKLIDERIAQLIEFRAAVLIQIFFRLKCRRIRRPTIVSMQLTQPTFKELVVESYCQHFIRNLKRKVKEHS